MREEALARLWRRVVPLWALRTLDGRPFRVVYPGRPGPGRGPDFRDALLQVGLEGRLLRGDVEVHLTPAGWREHRHQGDPAYAGVALQVVLRPEGPAEVPRAVGVPVPSAVLPLLSGVFGPASPPVPGLSPRDLDRLGDRRFRRKGRALAALARRVGAEEALYRALMRALGYPGREEAFLALAEGLPLACLRRCAPTGDPALLTALLLGGAGLLGEGDPLYPLWEATGLRPCLPPGALEAGPVRPWNRPARRLRGMARLLARHWRGGLWERLAGAVGAAKGPGEVLRALQVPGEGPGEPALLGRDRAGEMAVNGLLPLVWAWGGKSLRVRANALYRAWPPLAENALTREARRLFRVEGPLPARRGQGLLEAYRRFLDQAEAVGPVGWPSPSTGSTRTRG